MELKDRIAKARKDAGLTQEAMAATVGMSRYSVAKWELGLARPRPEAIEKLAKATGKPPSWFETHRADAADGLEVIGRVAAGIWKEGSVEFMRYRMPTSAPHPRYPADSQRLWLIEGTSINRLAQEGEYLHGVSVADSGIRPQDEDLVIVRRMEHGNAEYTAKVLSIRNGKMVLRPESTDPEWQGEFEVSGDDSTEIEILDVVIAKWSPLGRMKRA